MMRLADSAGLHDLLDGRLRVASANSAAKAAAVVAGMLVGVDSIDDLDVLRHGAMPRLFAGVRAPSTLGTFLRSFTNGNVRQLDAVASRLLAGLAARVSGLVPDGSPVAGADACGPVAFVDVDDTIREVHGRAKQGAAFGYSKVRGLNAQLATVSGPGSVPVIAAAMLRKGNVASATGAGRLLARALATARAAGVTGPVLARADSAYYGHAFVSTAIKGKAWFSVTARMNPAVIKAISSIGENAWTTIQYPNAVWDQAESHWVSEAEVAEATFTAFTGRRKAEHVQCRLVVRRVRRLNPATSVGQGELFAAWRYHAFITNSTLSTITADAHHRDHAVIEQTIAEFKSGPLAHLPSGKYTANAAWLIFAVIAFNLARAAAAAAGQTVARWATIRTRLINIPARIASTGRYQVLHLHTDWPWEHHWHRLNDLTLGPPAAAA